MDNSEKSRFVDATKMKEMNDQYYQMGEAFIAHQQYTNTFEIDQKKREFEEQNQIETEQEQRKQLFEQLEAMREKGMTEVEKNQKVVMQIKTSKTFENAQNLQQSVKSILKEIKQKGKC